MDASVNNWREHPFEIGGSYVAGQTFLGFPLSEFIVGRSYKLEGIAYSIYDSATVFTFCCAGAEDPIYWWWYDSEPQSLCLERFRVGA